MGRSIVFAVRFTIGSAVALKVNLSAGHQVVARVRCKMPTLENKSVGGKWMRRSRLGHELHATFTALTPHGTHQKSPVVQRNIRANGDMNLWLLEQ